MTKASFRIPTWREAGFWTLFFYVLLFTLSEQYFFSDWVVMFWEPFIPWLAKHVLHLSQPAEINLEGSGDALFNYVSVGAYAFFSVVAFAVLWVVPIRKPSISNVLPWFLVMVRYYLAYQMLSYGLSKIFLHQFPEPGLGRLIQPIGDQSRIGLLWSFMGFSKGYTYFTAYCEILGGILLLFRRSSLLGALLSLGILSNVLALNLFYGVPVKLFSFHLVVFSTLILLPDARRLLRFFILNKTTEPLHFPAYFKSKRWVRAKDVLKLLSIVFWIGYTIHWMGELVDEWGFEKAKSPLYGLYEVEEFHRDGEILPALKTDSSRWELLIIGRNEQALIRTMPGQNSYCQFHVDSLQQELVLKSPQDSLFNDTFAISRPDSNHVWLQGTQVKVLMRWKKREDFPLTGEQFRWIIE